MPARSKRRVLHLVFSLACIVVGSLGFLGVIGTAVGIGISRLTAPVTEFNPGLDHTFTIPDADRDSVIGVVVEELGDDSPETTLTVTTEAGEPVELRERKGYHTVFGRDQRMLANFTPPAGQTVFIARGESGPNERFVVGMSPEDVMGRVQKWAQPAGIAAIVILALGLGLLMAFFVTAPDTLSDVPDPQ